MEKRKTGDENRGHSCSLSLHFWSTSRSPIFTFYIPFQSSESQESNDSNHVRFGAEMRKIEPSEDNCIRLSENFARWKSRCEILSPLCENFAHLKPTCKIGTQRAKIGYFCRHFFLLIFLYLNFHFLFVFSHSCNSLARKYPRKGKITFLYKLSCKH